MWLDYQKSQGEMEKRIFSYEHDFLYEHALGPADSLRIYDGFSKSGPLPSAGFDSTDVLHDSGVAESCEF